MRVAVTGATGNLGSSIVPVLAGDPDVTGVVAIARRPPPRLPARTTFAVADIARTGLQPALEGCDALEARRPELRVVRLRPCFVFQRPAASEQARIFAGPLLPRMLVRPGRLPVVTVPRSLRFQVSPPATRCSAKR